jgi:hypothetical protein
VENRGWSPPEKVVGAPLAIHAGKSRNQPQYHDEDELELVFKDLVFGAIVATAVVDGWFHVRGQKRGLDRIPPAALVSWPWLESHGQYIEGPYCRVLHRVRVLKNPVPCRGFLGIWTLSVPLP